MGEWKRSLTAQEQRVVDAAREGARLRYEGKVVPHRSCGIALAETFGLATAPYQALRKGGLTGCGECGTAVASRLILGELLGDPDPAGPATERLRTAAHALEARWRERVGVGRNIACNTLVAPYQSFRGPDRALFCTGLAAESAALVAEILLRSGVAVDAVPVPDSKERLEG